MTTAKGQLGGVWGSAALILLLGGALLTGVTAAVTYQLVRRQRDAQTIPRLCDQLDASFGQQRSFAQAV